MMLPIGWYTVTCVSFTRPSVGVGARETIFLNYHGMSEMVRWTNSCNCQRLGKLLGLKTSPIFSFVIAWIFISLYWYKLHFPCLQWKQDRERLRPCRSNVLNELQGNSFAYTNSEIGNSKNHSNKTTSINRGHPN